MVLVNTNMQDEGSDVLTLCLVGAFVLGTYIYSLVEQRI